jgi:hypothetical protein
MDVLIADDHELLAQAVAEALSTNDDFSVAVTTSLSGVLIELDSNDYDIVLLDLRMPGMTGLSSIERILKCASKMGWLPPSPDGIAMCQDGGVKATKRKGRRDEGYDDRGGSGKECFPAPRSVDDGAVKFRKKLTREQFRGSWRAAFRCIVVFEACGSASYWAREMEALGHEVKADRAAVRAPLREAPEKRRR